MKMEAQIVLVDLDDIIPNRFQPRLTFEEESLNELAESIKIHGIIEPLVLRRVGPKFEIIAGERRFKASRIAGLAKVPAIVANLDDNESAEVAIIENTHRRDLSPIEEAKSYKKLLDRKYVSQEQLAKRLGKSQSAIANKIRLLNLDENVQTALMHDKISERHARSLLKLTDKLKQNELLNKIIEERWTVKKLDEEIEKILSEYKSAGNSLSGSINTTTNDINIDAVKNNAVDINPINPFQYKNANIINNPNGNLEHSNNLEKEAVNMNFGFNPFSTGSIEPSNVVEDVDFFDEIEEDEDEEIKEEVKVVEEKRKIETREDVMREIKKIIEEATTNDVLIKSEEFDFDNLYQIIIRLDKEEKK